MPEYLTPGVYFEFRDKAPVIRALRTDIAGFVGLAERGPLNEPLRVESWRQFQAQFGNFVHYSYLAYSVKGFFENGGRTCYVVRVAGATAAKSSLLLRNSASQDAIQLSAASEGTWANRIAIVLRRPSANLFSLVVTRDAIDRESFQNLSVDPRDARYFARLINQGDERTAPSSLIVAEVAPTAPLNASLLPDAAASGMAFGAAFLEGGADGVASLVRQDFLGETDPLAQKKRGLSAYDRVDAVGIVCIPDIHIQPAPIPPAVPPIEQPPRDPCRPGPAAEPVAGPPPLAAPEQPPAFSELDIFEVQRAMIEHCETRQDRVAILEVPVRRGAGETLSISEAQAWRSLLESERGFGGLYYPWIKVVNELNPTIEPLVQVPPCGHVAGVYARGDFEVGVHRAPANQEVFWAQDVTAPIDDDQQAVLNPDGINCLRAFPGRGIRVYGARTISSNPDWRFINVRRLMLMIEEAVDESTQWTVFEPNDFNLRQSIVTGLNVFLEGIWRKGALVGGTPQEAYFVKCDDTNNPAAILDQGKLITDVGVAPTRPAEFIVFRVGRTSEELEIVER